MANLTRRDGEEFLQRVSQFRIQTHALPFPLEQANEVLAALRAGKIQGAAVLIP